MQAGMSDAELVYLGFKEMLMISLWLHLYMLFFVFVALLPCPPVAFLLDLKHSLRKKDVVDHTVLALLCLANVLSCFMGMLIGYLMINKRYGPAIENFITYIMGDNPSEKGYGKSPRSAALIQSPNDVVKVNRLVIVRCAFVLFQTFLYMMGCLEGVEYQGKLAPDYGIFMFVTSSVVWLAIFKLFAASHKYCLTIAKWIITQSIVVEIVTLSYYGFRQESFDAFRSVLALFMGAIPILAALYVVRNPVEKLYTVYHNAKNQIIDLEKGDELLSPDWPYSVK